LGRPSSGIQRVRRVPADFVHRQQIPLGVEEALLVLVGHDAETRLSNGRTSSASAELAETQSGGDSGAQRRHLVPCPPVEQPTAGLGPSPTPLLKEIRDAFCPAPIP
jgi:hypothetical protein